MSGTEKAEEAPIISFGSEKVALGPGRREEVPLVLRWRNDPNLAIVTGFVFWHPLTTEALEAQMESATKGDGAAREAIFTIYDRASLRPIGRTSLRDIDADRSTAEFGIYIGEREYWGRGYGTEVTILMLDYGFHILGLHSILLTTWSDNARAIGAYTRAGFRPIGIRRETARRNGQFADLLYMDCLATEFQSPLPPVLTLT